MSEKLKEADRLRLRVQKIPDYLSLSESIREWLCVGVAREEADGGGLCEHGERVDTGTEESLCIGNFGTHSFALMGVPLEFGN